MKVLTHLKVNSAVVLILDQTLVNGWVLAGGTCSCHRWLIQILSDLTKDVPQCWQLIVDWGFIDTAAVSTVSWIWLCRWIVHHIGICIHLRIIGQWITFYMHGSLTLSPSLTLTSSILIAASKRWFTRSIAFEQRCISLFLARALLMMAWTWSDLTVVLWHNGLEGLTTGHLWTTVVVESIGAEAVNRLLRLLQLGQTVGTLGIIGHSVPQIVNWGFLLLLTMHSLSGILLSSVLLGISEATSNIVSFDMSHLRQWIKGGRCWVICRRFHRCALSRWLISRWSRAQWHLISRTLWLVIDQGYGCSRRLSSGTRHNSTVNRWPHFLSCPICQTWHLQRQVSIARVMMCHHPNWLKVVDVLSILILILISLLRVDSRFLWWKATFQWQFIMIWPLFGF